MARRPRHGDALASILGWAAAFALIFLLPFSLGIVAMFDANAMLLGGTAFIALLVAFTRTPFWQRHIDKSPHRERALRWTMGLFMASTLVSPFGAVLHIGLFVLTWLALGAALGTKTLRDQGFTTTLCLTLLHGSAACGCMAGTYGWLCLVLSPRPGDAVEPLSTHCDKCDYDLRGSLDAARCPECGAAFRADRVRAAMRAEQP